MGYAVLADLLLIVHLFFILFVVSGGLLVVWWRGWIWLHLPAAAWGAMVEIMGWYCPLTPWEWRLRRLAGEAGYEGSFVEHYLLPLIYPSGLTRGMQLAMGLSVVLINLGFYLWIWRKNRRG